MEILSHFAHLHHFLIVALAAIIIVGLANVADCVDAMVTARSTGLPIESAKLRHALWKLAKEWVLLIAVLMVDTLAALCWTELPYITVVVAILMVAVEVLSMFEHARLRRDKLVKIPESVKDLVEFFGEEELKKLMRELARRRVGV